MIKARTGMRWALAGLASALLIFACGKQSGDIGGTGPIVPKDTAKLDATRPTDTLRFATLNMSIGFPVSQLIFKDMANPAVAYNELDSLFKRYQRTRPKDRMIAMARIIDSLKLDVVGLQEVMRFTKDGVLVDDYLQQLADAIKAGGGPAYAVLPCPLNDTLLTGTKDGNTITISFHEGNALLVHPSLMILDNANFIYFSLFRLPLANATRTQRALGYVKVRSPKGITWQIWNTHLEVFEDVSSSQAKELLVLRDSLRIRTASGDDSVPQIVLGDFNAAPNEDAHRVMQEGGFTDTFDPAAVDPGYSCCVSGSSLWDTTAAFSNRRIDFIFGRHVLKAFNHGIGLAAPFTAGDGTRLLATDHRMVHATVVGQ
jgi:endonuclease/exonuclease/phosphatase family metal-dependent hydrolase